MLREGYLTWLSDTASFFITIITIWRCNCWKQKTWSITRTRHVLSARTNWGWYIRWSTLVPRARRTAIRRSSDSRSKRWKITRHLSIRKDRAVDLDTNKSQGRLPWASLSASYHVFLQRYILSVTSIGNGGTCEIQRWPWHILGVEGFPCGKPSFSALICKSKSI